MNHKLNWDTNYLIPKFLKSFIDKNLYKTNLLKDFIIVAMYKNYTSNNLKTNKISKSIILNKSLVIKPMDTKNLITTFTKTITQDNIIEKYKVEVYKIVIHINNSFNPTNIGLFDKDNNIHLYQLYGDSTLHINIGLLTLFKILRSENLKVNKIKNKSEGDYYSNSNLSLVIERLLKTETVTLYTLDSSKE